jgi:hypothetical protein
MYVSMYIGVMRAYIACSTRAHLNAFHKQIDFFYVVFDDLKVCRDIVVCCMCLRFLYMCVMCVCVHIHDCVYLSVFEISVHVCHLHLRVFQKIFILWSVSGIKHATQHCSASLPRMHTHTYTYTCIHTHAYIHIYRSYIHTNKQFIQAIHTHIHT